MLIPIILLVGIYILNIIDYLQTVYAIRSVDIGVEANPIVRFLLLNNYAWIVKFIAIPIILIIMGIILKFDRKQIWAPCFLFILYCAVVISNFIQIKKNK
jgi:hypothetical protein